MTVPTMQRLPHFVMIICLLATCWFAMQAIHELGHVLGACYTGGTVAKVVLRPWTISQTQLTDNPEPVLVAWAGPVIGAALPVAVWLVAAVLRCPAAYLLRFFAGFCLVANGAYIGGGALDKLGDAGDLQRHGSPLWALFLFAAVTVPAGLLLWHREGRQFGFGGSVGKVEGRAVLACLLALIVVVLIDFTFGSSK
jgi:hypothetical protein